MLPPPLLRRLALVSLLASLASVAPRAVRADEREEPLPRSRAPHEVGLPLPPPEVGTGPPPGPVDTPAEYEPAAGLLLAWEGFDNELEAVARAVTTVASEGRVWVFVDDAAEQQSAASDLAAAGVDMDEVDFLVKPTNSVWIRDYGPRFIVDGGVQAIVDHTYNRPSRPLDNEVPDWLAAEWGETSYDLPLTHGGGNFHLFADGDAFMSDLILDENPGLTATDVEAYFAAYEGLDLTIWPRFPASFDSTGHIDMWMLPVRDKVAIIGEYDSSTGAPHTITEDAVGELTARGYTVFRTPGWRAGGTHYTYTNAVVFNDVVLVPEYSGYGAENAQALGVFEAAFPDRTIVPIDGSFLVTFAGVFHCIVMHVPDSTRIFSDGFESGDLGRWSTIVN